MKEAVLINTAGGINGGYKFEIKLDLALSKIVATSKTAERLYNGIGSTANINIHLTIDEGSTLHWLPQETIVFENTYRYSSCRSKRSSRGNSFPVTLGISNEKYYKRFSTFSRKKYKEDWVNEMTKELAVTEKETELAVINTNNKYIDSQADSKNFEHQSY